MAPRYGINSLLFQLIMHCRRFKYNFLLLCMILTGIFFNACATRQVIYRQDVLPVEQFQFEIHTILNNPAFSNAICGVAIQSLKTGEFLYLQNENKGFVPASNVKLFTTAAACAMLDSEFRFKTHVLIAGKPDSSGILNGDLIIRGKGDPCPGWTSGDSSDSVKLILIEWAEKLKQAGIRRINGNIIGDDNYFDDQPLGSGWAWDDETESYSAQISALSLLNNCVRLTITVNDGEDWFTLFPNTRFVTFENHLHVLPDLHKNQILISRKRGTNYFRIAGSVISDSAGICREIPVENPTQYFLTVLKETLTAEGIEVKGEPVDIDDYSGDEPTTETELFVHESEPLAELIKYVNKESQNLWAEQIFRTLGAELRGIGSEWESRQVMNSFLAKAGIDPDAISIQDGSGLSRQNMATPFQIVTLLRYMYQHPDFKYFYESLPIAGVDGTLEFRMKATAAEGRVRAKTGSMNRVNALSGYLTSLDGEVFAFSFITNHYTVPSSMVRRQQDLICERLANFSRK